MYRILLLSAVYSLSSAAVAPGPVYPHPPPGRTQTVQSRSGEVPNSFHNSNSNNDVSGPVNNDNGKSNQFIPPAQARESVALTGQDYNADTMTSQSSKGFRVYYVPNGFTSGKTVASEVTALDSSYWSWNNWRDTTLGVSSVACILIGGSLFYSMFSTKSERAFRALQDLKAEDAARMARGVLRALQKFQKMNEE